MRVSAPVGLFASLAVLAAAAAPAAASGTGGVAAEGAPARTPARHVTPAVPPHAAPVTARSSSLSYTGPVYQRSATGEVVPYQPATVGAPAAGGVTGAGGSPVGLVAPHLPLCEAASPDADPALVVADAVGQLLRYSLVDRDERGLRMHRLVQGAARDRSTPSARAGALRAAVRTADQRRRLAARQAGRRIEIDAVEHVLASVREIAERSVG